jgi:hypothetical protein
MGSSFQKVSIILEKSMFQNISIQRPSGQSAESAQILMKQMRKGVSVFGLRGHHEEEEIDPEQRTTSRGD